MVVTLLAAFIGAAIGAIPAVFFAVWYVNRKTMREVRRAAETNAALLAAVRAGQQSDVAFIYDPETLKTIH
jgi:hypothetical protein